MNEMKSGPTTVAPSPDAHGQAALLLVESLIHGLVDRRALTTADALEIVEVAAEVKIEIGMRGAEPGETVALSLALLDKIAASLRIDSARPAV